MLILIFLSLNERKIFNNEEAEFKEKYGVLVNEFRKDKGLAGVLYFALYTFRRLAYIICQILLVNYHIVQISLNCAISFACFIYILKYFPVIDKVNLISNILSEVTVFICFNLVLILANNDSLDVERYIERLFCYFILGFLCVNSFTILYNLIIFIKNFWFIQEKERALRFAKEFELYNN